MNQYRSELIDQLMGSLAAAQGDYKPLEANEIAPGGKFANLAAVIAATREALSVNNLCLYFMEDLKDEGDGASIVRTYLGHSSGQFISSAARFVYGKNERQNGNRLETVKKRQAMLLLGIAPTKNDPFNFDDNCEELGEAQVLEELKKPAIKRDIDYSVSITTDQYNDLLIELNGYPEIAKDVLEVFGITTLADLPKSEYHPALQKIRRIKKTADEYDRRSR